MTPMKLSTAALPVLPEDIIVPTYDRNALRAGIVHIGVGNFHRGHQAWYLHRLMQQGIAQDWAIIGAGVRPYDAAMRDKLLEQDCLTTLVELDPKGSQVEIIGSMIDYLPIEDGHGPLIAQMARPEIRVISMTVTEGGYYTDPATGGFYEAHPDIQGDIISLQRPVTAFGAIVAALRLRRENDAGPVTLLSCDNLQGNGGILRQTIVGLAQRIDSDLSQWIDTQCSFPNSMVDCIVPATGPDELAMVQSLGFSDAVPVTHESFRQWVIEDDFCAGRPALELVGATLTDDVHSYESMKIRVLNGGHQILANAGEILSIATIADCMEDTDLRAFFCKVQETEVLPFVDAVPGYEAIEYLRLVERRFANPTIHDTTRRVAFDGSSRHSGFIHPVARAAIATNASISGLALVEALWARMCAGVREDASEILPNDPIWDSLKKAARDARKTPQVWLEQVGIYGDIAKNPAFAEAFGKWLRMLWSNGTRETLRAYLST